MKVTIAIGSDHRGYKLKSWLQEQVMGPHWIDVGAKDTQSSDYPVFARKVCDAILAGPADFGILICGSGVGMSIAANRFAGIFAALCWNSEVAIASKSADCANVLVLPADFISDNAALETVQAWLQTGCAGEERHRRRRGMIDSDG